MLPIFPAVDKRYGAFADIEAFSDGAAFNAKPKQVFDLRDFFARQFRLTIVFALCFQSKFYRMCIIFFWSAIFKVLEVVVQLVSVEMVNYILSRTWPNERKRYKSMHGELFMRSVVQFDSGVTTRDMRSKDAPTCVTNTSKLRNLIKIFVAGDRLPCFLCGMLRISHDVNLLHRFTDGLGSIWHVSANRAVCILA